eukprot:1294234-Amphidinium_carterae.2
MAAGQVPVLSTVLRKCTTSSIATSGSKRSSPMLHLSTPLALPREQWTMMLLRSPVSQEDWEVCLLGKVACPGCHRVLPAASSA